MAKLSCFMMVSLDGYYARPDGDMRWAHRRDPEYDEFAANNAQSRGALLFGRITFEQMRAFWPTPAARAARPAVAEGVNRAPKFVVSRTLERPDWENSELVRGELVPAVERLKRDTERTIVILGSASLVAQLSEARLIDEYQIVVNPVAIGAGRSLFAGMKGDLELSLVETRTFKHGVVFSRYALR
jgi:dihydrofolate reductase